MNEVETCPISLEPLAGVIGLTVLGSAYHLEPLRLWLSDPDHDTDPLTGEWLPSKVIVQHDLGNDPDMWKRLRDRRLDLRNSTFLWTDRRSYAVDAEVQAQIRTCAQFAQDHFYAEPLWQEYEHHVCGLLNHLCQYMSDLDEVQALRRWQAYYLAHLTNVVKVSIPEFPADNFFVGVRVGQHIDFEKPFSFKGWCFNGADFRGLTCFAGFPECKFICADLRGARFIKSDFSGERVNFTGALVNPQTLFAVCEIEREATWRKLETLEDKIAEFRHRGLGQLAKIM